MMSLRWKTRRGRRGMTLLEVSISLVILVLSMGGAMRAHLGAQRLLSSSRETDLATDLLAGCMQELLLQPAAELHDAAGAYAPGAPLSAGALLADQVVVYATPGTTAADPLPDVLTIRVQVSWTAAAGQLRSLAMVGARR